MSNNKSKYDKINYGLSLLKMLLAFEVLLGHFADWKEYDPRYVWPFRELVSLAVPCFVIISFFFLANSFLSRDEGKFKSRMEKLLIPQIGWAFIYYVIYLVIDLTLHVGLHEGFMDLVWQLLTGHSRYLNATMWYQVDIIVISFIFYLIFKFFDNKKALVTLLLLMLFCYFLQISGINVALFGELIFELKYPLGRIAEVIPFAVIGFLIQYFKVFDRIKRYRYIIMPLCVVLFMAGFYVPWPVFKDFGFSGFAKPYLALCIVTFAYMVPLEYVSLSIKKAILTISNYSLGIYCIHRLINTLMNVFVPSFQIGSFERCIVLYIVCYFVCMLIDKIGNKKISSLVN